MVRDKLLYAKLQRDLLSDFTELSEFIENGVHKYLHNYIMATLENKYYMKSLNIMKLIKKSLKEQVYDNLKTSDDLQKNTPN